MFASHFELWLLPARVEQLQSSCESARGTSMGSCGAVGEGTMTQEPVVAARGEIRQKAIPVLAHYGTSYAFFDEVGALMEVGCR